MEASLPNIDVLYRDTR